MKKFPICLALAFAFLLGIRDGYVALWREGHAEPEAVFPYRAESLPDADRKALEQGIRIETEAELSQLLEDYLS